jgi:hypothetical protein
MATASGQQLHLLTLPAEIRELQKKTADTMKMNT